MSGKRRKPHARQRLRSARPRAGALKDRIVRQLTGRQQLVYDLTLAGLPIKQIAVRLGITARTVRNHRELIFRKLGVHCAIELAARFARRQLDAPSPAVASDGADGGGATIRGRRYIT